MEEVFILSAVRTAIGKFGGSLSDIPASVLGTKVIGAAVERAGVPADVVDEVLMGQTLQAGQGQNPARQASLAAGIPRETPAMTINKVCGSGLRTVMMGAQFILAGDADVVVAGGMENMSAAPFLAARARWGYRMGHAELVDAMIKDGLWCAFTDVHMGITAENIAERYGISRREQDEFAAASQQKAGRAIDEGRFREEIVPVTLPRGKGAPQVFDQDEFPRPDATADSLAALKPAFKKDGTVTAGNASGINDAAAAVVLCRGSRARELGVKPLAVIRGYAAAGVDPAYMGLGPVPATRKALVKAGLGHGDIGLVEANEAFAAQALAVMRDLGLDPACTNVNGGAIALGHPIGASGTRILVTLVHEMKRRGVRHGLATLCIGGGQGVAVVVESC